MAFFLGHVQPFLVMIGWANEPDRNHCADIVDAKPFISFIKYWISMVDRHMLPLIHHLINKTDFCRFLNWSLIRSFIELFAIRTQFVIIAVNLLCDHLECVTYRRDAKRIENVHIHFTNSRFIQTTEKKNDVLIKLMAKSFVLSYINLTFKYEKKKWVGKKESKHC